MSGCTGAPPSSSSARSPSPACSSSDAATPPPSATVGDIGTLPPSVATDCGDDDDRATGDDASADDDELAAPDDDGSAGHRRQRAGVERARRASIRRGRSASQIDGNRVIMIGDSVLASISNRYGNQLCTELVPRRWVVEVDAEVGRRIEFGRQVLAKRGDDDWDAAVILLGNNYGGDADAYGRELGLLLDELGPIPVVLVTVTRFRPIQDQVNYVLHLTADAARQRPPRRLAGPHGRARRRQAARRRPPAPQRDRSGGAGGDDHRRPRLGADGARGRLPALDVHRRLDGLRHRGHRLRLRFRFGDAAPGQDRARGSGSGGGSGSGSGGAATPTTHAADTDDPRAGPCADGRRRPANADRSAADPPTPTNPPAAAGRPQRGRRAVAAVRSPRRRPDRVTIAGANMVGSGRSGLTA